MFWVVFWVVGWWVRSLSLLCVMGCFLCLGLWVLGRVGDCSRRWKWGSGVWGCRRGVRLRGLCRV